MKGELVSISTADRVRLEGFFCEVDREAESTTAGSRPQAAILVHGLSGNFYKSRLLKHFAEALHQQHITTLLVNTRGHDYLNATARMGKSTSLGAAYEIIDECKHDLYAWAEFLAKRNYDDVLLLGHSLGAIKSLYSQAHHRHPAIGRIAAFSATKLSYDSLLASSGGERFSHWITTAQNLVEQERGDELMFVDFPFPTWMSANAYLGKYGERDRYNWLTWKEQISIPTLAAFGQREMIDNPAFEVMGPELNAITQSNFDVRFIPNADHFYTACYAAATSELFAWLDNG